MSGRVIANRRSEMRVQGVRMPVTDAESWTVLDDDCRPEPAIEQYLAYLAALARPTRCAPTRRA